MLTRRVMAIGWRAATVGVAIAGAGLVVVLIASIQGMIDNPGASLLDGYWIGLLPLMGVGPWLILLGAKTAMVGGLAAVLVGGPALSRILALGASIVAGLWWLMAVQVAGVRCRPDGACSSSDLGAAVYSLPEAATALLILPALAVALLAARGRPVHPRSGG